MIKGNPHFNDTVVIKAVRQWRYPPGNEDVGVTSATVYVTRNGCDADPPDLKPLSAVRPVYPPAAKTVQIQGGVESLLTAEKDGSVSSAEPLTGDLQLSQAAVDAVHQWGYPPMEKSTKTDVVLPFTIPKGESSADLVIPPLAIYQPDPASTRKNLTKVAKSHGIVQLEITVLADGTKGEEKVTKPLDTVRDEEALQTVKTREYLPALKSGMPVACKTPVSVYFRLF